MKVNPLTFVHRTSYIVLALLLFVSCQKEDLLETVNEVAINDEVPNENNEGMTVISERKKNPFTVANMRNAYANVNTKDKNGSGSGSLNIRTTHLYVKFLPQDSTEVEALEQLEITDDLNLFDYPLDVDIITPGTYYHDPSVPANMPTPKYTAVTFDYVLPQNISYTILDSLYLPETDMDTLNKSNNEAFIQDLQNEAFKLTGNLDDIVLDKGSKFYPSGYMKVENSGSSKDGFGTEGAPYVKVTARYWFTLKSAYTSNSGYYFINHQFKNKVNYQMKFNHQFAFVNSSLIGTVHAYKDGPKQKSGWSYTSWKGMRSYLYKIIMRGVHDWHNIYVTQFGLPAPPYNLKIRAQTGNLTAWCSMVRTTLTTNLTPQYGVTLSSFFNDIQVGNHHEEYYMLYKTTVHELAHAVHWKSMGTNDYQRGIRMIRSKKMVREGWAMAFTDHAIKHKYNTFWYYSQCRSLSAMKADERPRLLGQDMWDNTNQALSPNNCSVTDDVSGIPLQDLFTTLQGVGDWGTNSENYRMMLWRDNLKALHPSQDTEIHNYFSQYHLN